MKTNDSVYDDDTWDFDECVSRVNQSHKERTRIARELEKTREQDRKQWEFENGGRNPIGNDPEGLDREEQEMYRRLGEQYLKDQRHSDTDDSLFSYIIIIVSIVAFFYLYNKHFG